MLHKHEVGESLRSIASDLEQEAKKKTDEAQYFSDCADEHPSVSKLQLESSVLRIVAAVIKREGQRMQGLKTK